MNKADKMKTRPCPTCKGSGLVMSSRGGYAYYTQEVRDKARAMYREGVSLRVIGKELGIDHPMKVLSLINSVRF